MNDGAKFLFKVYEHITLEFCCYTKNELMAISQFHGLEMDARTLRPKLLINVWILKYNYQGYESCSCFVWYSTLLCSIFASYLGGCGCGLGFVLFSGKLPPKIMSIISSHIIVVSNCWKLTFSCTVSI